MYGRAIRKASVACMMEMVDGVRSPGAAIRDAAILQQAHEAMLPTYSP